MTTWATAPPGTSSRVWIALGTCQVCCRLNVNFPTLLSDPFCQHS